MKLLTSYLTTLLFVVLFSVSSQAQMKITCNQAGAFVANFKLSYSVDSRNHEEESGNLDVGKTHVFNLSQNARDIKITVYTMYFIGVWHDYVQEVDCGGTFTLSGLLHNERRIWVPDQKSVNVSETNASGDTKLHIAIRSNDTDEVNRLFRNNFTMINAKNNRGLTPLHEAVGRGNITIIDILIRKGANVEIADNKGQKPLDLAIQKGNMEIVQKLIDHGADLDGVEKTMEKAVQQRKVELVELLLDNGAKPTTAMEYAMKFNNKEFYQSILENHNVPVTNAMFTNAVSERKYPFAELLLEQNINMNEALDVALKSNQKQLIFKVLDREADPNKALSYAVDQKDETLATELIINYSADPNPVFVKAINTNQSQLVQTMIENGADPELGMTPSIESGKVQMVTLLLDAGAEPGNHLVTAVKSGKTEIVKSLIIKGADPNSGLSTAMSNKQFEIAQVLVEAGAEPVDVVATAVKEKQTALLKAALSRNADANPGLVVAVEQNNTEIVRLLIEAGADVTRSNYTETAARAKNSQMISLLLEAGANPNPGLPVAVEQNSTDIVRLLIEAGADVTRGNYTETAAKAGNSQMMSLLLEAGADPNPAMMVAVDQGDATLLKKLIDKGAHVDNPLFISKSVTQQKVNMVQILLLAGANPNPGMGPAVEIMNVEIARILLAANADASPVSFIQKACTVGNLAMVDLLIKHGADANAGMLPAIKSNKAGVVQKLLTAGADGSASSLVIAATPHNNPSLTDLLFQAGADPHAALSTAVSSNADQVLIQIIGMGVEVSDRKYLSTAVQKDFVATTKVLIENGADPTGKEDVSGFTLMHVAAKNNSSAMVSLLASHGVGVNDAATSGDTPLHFSVKHGNKGLPVVERLINLGADVNARNASGQIIFKAAKGRKIKKLLKKNNASKK